MSDIQNKLKSLEPYVRGIRLIEGTGIVDVVFKKEWVIPTSEVIKKELIDSDRNYYIFFTEDENITLDNLLDYIENIIDKNIENELKNELLKEYINKLQDVFNDNSLEKLKKLEFSFNTYKTSVKIEEPKIEEPKIEEPKIEEPKKEIKKPS